MNATIAQSSEAEKAKTLDLSPSLFRVFASCYDLYLKTQSCHWHYQGSNFFALDKLTENLYKDLAEHIDLLAERIRALGGLVPDSFAALQTGSIFNLELVGNAEGLVNCTNDLGKIRVLISFYKQYGSFIKQEMPEADIITADIFLKLLAWQEHNTWLLSSHL